MPEITAFQGLSGGVRAFLTCGGDPQTLWLPVQWLRVGSSSLSKGLHRLKYYYFESVRGLLAPAARVK